MVDAFVGIVRKALVGASLAVAVHCAWAYEVVGGDFNQILRFSTTQPMVWQIANNPSVYVFDFPGLTAQGRTFNRVTQFTEQRFGGEPYPRVLDDTELAQHIAAARRTTANFAFGHDLLVGELAQFFNYALRDKVQLNESELRLKEFLVQQGLIREFRGFIQAVKPEVVVLSVPQSQQKTQDEPTISMGARYTILLHEMSHAEFYTNTHYNKFCYRFWTESLTETQRELFKKFLRASNYSVENEELVINEMQAYLMFTPDPKSFSAAKLGVGKDELESMRSLFRRAKPPIGLPLTLIEGM